MKISEICAGYRAYRSGRLEQPPWPLDPELEEHPELCSECAAFGTALEGLPGLFDSLRSAQVPADLFERIRLQAPRSAPERFRALALQLAAGVIGFLSVWPFLGREAGGGKGSNALVGTQELFLNLERSLSSDAAFDPTPEGQLLEHIYSSKDLK